MLALLSMGAVMLASKVITPVGVEVTVAEHRTEFEDGVGTGWYSSRSS
ncbi:hypothetical protein ACIGXA_38885 [Streptomyces fildesensis]|uniref:Uncharacterized protein n=1 Tax=Streptomyces fildesensis TaxID=375757 RepID=A0ABW8CMD9_9ACTN